MKNYTFRMTRKEMGDVTISAESYDEAKEKAYDYAKRIIHVNNKPWYDLRTIDHQLMKEGKE